MAEAAVGLAFGTASLAGLFTTCVQCFEMVELGLNYSRDFEIILTSFEVQRVRLMIWGEALRLDTSPDPILDRADVQAAIYRGLNCIKMLFDDGKRMASKYGLQKSTTQTPGQLSVFRETFRRFRERMVAHQAQASFITKTKWAICNRNKFKSLVDDLKSLIDDLNSITASTEIFRRQRAIVEYEIASVSDEGSLRLIEDAGTITSNQLSDAASQRLVQLNGQGNGSIVEAESITATFWSAQSRANNVDTTGVQEAEPNTGDHSSSGEISQNQRIGQGLVMDRTHPELAIRPPPQPPVCSIGIPIREPIVFPWTERGELGAILIEDGFSASKSTMLRVHKLLTQGHDAGWRSGLARLDAPARALIGFFEGPLATPYEGGVFYVRIHLPEDYPMVPPVCQLLTKVYHPNIDSRGRICMDTLHRNWSPAVLLHSLVNQIASMLDDPCLEDPLVPEIAAQCLKDHDAYNQVARQYTLRYATSEIPEVPISYGDKPWWQAVRISYN